MDTSKDSMQEAAYQYLRTGNVELGRYITVDAMGELLHEVVSDASQLFSELSLSEIKNHIFGSAELPGEIGSLRAIKIYSIGEEAWSDVDPVEYWFVDRGGSWFYVKTTLHGQAAEFTRVTSMHLAVRQADENNLVPVGLYATICLNIRILSDKASRAAEERQKKMDRISKKFQTKIDRSYGLSI